MTKLLVATGASSSDPYLSNVEIVDFSSNWDNCLDLLDFPRNVTSPIGGFYDLKNPIICGGWTGQVQRQLL